jgi:uncharacterized membrane protein
MAYDGATEKPSITLLAFYLGIMLSVISLILLHIDKDKYLIATGSTLLFLGMTFIFYRIRNLDKVKIDLDDRSIELEDNGEKK